MFGYWSLCAILLGAIIDFFVGDPHCLPHPVVLMGKLISLLETALRRIFPKTKAGENAAGGVLFYIMAAVCFAVPAALLMLCHKFSHILGFIVESIMCWQCLAARSLAHESSKVKRALDTGDLSESRRAVSMIVGRDTENLDASGVARAAVETVAENTSDGVIAPLIFLTLGGGPLGMLYKAVNTMDSMLGYVEPPYKNFGLVPARMDDAFNFIPARLSALIMLLAGGLLGFDIKNGMRIFKRDRYKHASPNSAQTESVMAGLLGLRLAGDAFYHGILHKKQFIGDALREIEPKDIDAANSIMLWTAALALVFFAGLRLAIQVIVYALQH